MSTPTQRSFIIRYRFRALQLYLLLLLTSHLTALFRAPAPHAPLQPDAATWVLLDPLDRSAPLLKTYAAENPGIWSPALVGLNHPGPSQSFSNLAHELPEPDHPVLLIANGHAGGVALHFAAQHPEAVSGLVLLNATGVQELSLLGEYHLNYALYALSELALSSFLAFTPHFDQRPRLRQQRDQIRTLRDSDRRVLRPLFDQIQSPVLLVDLPRQSLRHHAAREHRRLLPQSQSVTLAPNAPIKPTLDRYTDELARGRPATRSRAPEARLKAATDSYDPSQHATRGGPTLWLLLFAISLATLFTEDLTCALTGLMIANGTLTWAQGIGACLAGILVWDYMIYLTGRILGRPALHRIPLRWMIDPVTLRETEEWFDRRIASAIFVSRFIPGTRMPAYLAAGILNVPAKPFTLYFVIAALLWTPLIIILSANLAEVALDWIARFQHTAPAIVVVAILLYLLFTHIFLPAFSWRGRRKLTGKWRRLTRPEYWPARLLYLPTSIFLLLRALRRGNHILDFTACNPCMPASGVSGESKAAILDQIAARDALAPYLLLPGTLTPAEQKARAETWMSDQGIAYPVVIKPDTGEKGQGVHFCADAEALLQILNATREEDQLLQAAQSGREYGVFWLHPPDDATNTPTGTATGRITAITLKTFPTLTGDGKRNLEDLILADPRAVCQARVYFEKFRDRLYDIPAPGESIPLTQIGNHAMGTRFDDGMHLLTPALTTRIRQISQSLPGFHLGRYDLFAPDDAAFQAGENLQIIELNGVTSEPTSLYQPGHTYRHMAGTLLRQWKIASDIGKHNRQQGTRILTFAEFFHLFDDHNKRNYLRKLRDFSRKHAKPKPPQP